MSVSCSSGQPCVLSVSMGHATADLRVETIDEFMNRIDRQMSLDKAASYQNHDRRKTDFDLHGSHFPSCHFCNRLLYLLQT